MRKFLEVAQCFRLDLNESYKVYFTVANKKLYVKMTIEVVDKHNGNTVIAYQRKCFRWELINSREKVMDKTQKWLDKHVTIVNRIIEEHGIDAEITMNSGEDND